MKLAVLCLCILHLAFVSAGLFICNNLQTGCSNVSVSRAQAPERTGPLNQGRHRTLFARRGQYERQRVRVPKPKVAPVPPNAPLRPLKWHQTLLYPSVLCLHKAVRPSPAAVTRVPHATAASSMRSASAGRQTRNYKKKT